VARGNQTGYSRSEAISGALVDAAGKCGSNRGIGLARDGNSDHSRHNGRGRLVGEFFSPRMPGRSRIDPLPCALAAPQSPRRLGGPQLAQAKRQRSRRLCARKPDMPRQTERTPFLRMFARVIGGPGFSRAAIPTGQSFLISRISNPLVGTFASSPRWSRTNGKPGETR
jgi:hypothetical protein